VLVSQIVRNKENFTDYQRLEIGWDENHPLKVIKTENLYSSGSSTPWAMKLTLHEIGTDSEIGLMIPSVYERMGDLEATVGDEVRATGAFQLYFGDPQLWLASWDELEVVG
jgi:hypothetical protein